MDSFSPPGGGDNCCAVLAVYARALLEFYGRRARRRGIAGGLSGSVTAIQRVGSGLTLDVHFHTLVLDGVFAVGETGDLQFHPTPPPTDAEVARVVGKK